MHQQLDSYTARSLFSEFRTWFGTPRLVLVTAEGRKTIDGRTRESVADGLDMPTTYATTPGDAARLLCLVGHYDRARTFVPPQLRDCRDVAAYCHCDVAIVAPMTARRRPKPEAASKAENTARRRNAIDRMRRALREAENEGGAISAERIRQLLAPWL